VKRLIWFSLILGLVASAHVRYLGIDDFIAAAVRNSPDLNISRADYNASVQRARSARGDYLPRVDLTAGGGMTGIHSEISGQDTRETSHLLTGTLSANQLIYDFGRTLGNIRASDYDANATRARLLQRLRDKIYDVKKAFYNVLKARTLIDVNRKNVALNEQQLHRARRYFEAGIRTRIDVSDARVNLIKARLGLQNATYGYRRARIRLTATVGIDPYGGHYELDAPDFNASHLYETLPDVDQPFESLETYAYAHRYTLQAYAQAAQSAAARVTAARSGYFPQLFLKGDYTRSDLNEKLQIYTPQQQWDAMLTLNWNLFEGFKTDARTQEARSLALKSKAAYSDAKLKIRQEVADAHTVLLKIRDSVKLSQSLAEAAKEKFVQAQKRYEHGLSDFIELQQARQGYIDADAGLVTTYYDFFIALARRDKAIGK